MMIASTDKTQCCKSRPVASSKHVWRHVQIGLLLHYCDKTDCLPRNGAGAAVAVGRAVARPSPARIPACGITALGSSDRLASASPTAIASSEVGTGSPTFHSRSVFPVKAASACQSLPRVNGVTVSEYYGLIRLPAVLGFPTWSFGRPTCHR